MIARAREVSVNVPIPENDRTGCLVNG